MKSSLRPPTADHPSYSAHRRQVWAQIVLPVVVGTVAFVVVPIVAWVAAAGGSGDVGRWAMISTMWLLIPVMIMGAIFLALLIALILVTGKIAGWIPQYSYRAQRISARVAGGTGRAAEFIRRPALAVRELGSLAKKRLKRLRERA